MSTLVFLPTITGVGEPAACEPSVSGCCNKTIHNHITNQLKKKQQQKNILHGLLGKLKNSILTIPLQ
jgi:hypothetical protein